MWLLMNLASLVWLRVMLLQSARRCQRELIWFLEANCCKNDIIKLLSIKQGGGMKLPWLARVVRGTCLLLLVVSSLASGTLCAADRVNFLYTARVMSQAYPWIAQEAGLYKKYDLDVGVCHAGGAIGSGDFVGR
jgi:hypothetical protein